MRRKFKFIVLGLIILIGVTGCSKRMAPVSIKDNKVSSYDGAAFDYVYVEAIKQKLLGNGGDALKYLEQCVSINPSSDAAYYQMAQILINSGDNSNAKKYALKAIAINNENIWYLLMMAGIYYQEQNIDSTIIYYEEAVKFFPEMQNLQLTLGNLYSEKGEFNKAQILYDNLDKKYGPNETSTLASINSLMNAGRYSDAKVKIEALIKLYPDEILYKGLLAESYNGIGDTIKAMELFRSMLNENPENAQIQLAFADFLISQKDYDELMIVINSIVINQNIKREDKITVFTRLLEVPELGEYHGQDMILASKVLEDNYPGDEIIVLLRPEILISENKLDDAAIRLEDIIKDQPDNYYAFEKLLLIYMQEGNYNKLYQRGKEAATKFNRSFLVKILYANGAIETKNFDVALEELRKADILAGSDTSSKNQVLTMRADIYYRMKNYIKAFDTFEQAIKLKNDDIIVLNNYAYYLAEQNMKLKEAEEMAHQVIEIEPENTTFLDTYAWVLYKRGKLVEAAGIMEKIINSGQNPDAEWYEHYGYILKGQMKCNEAISAWQLALKLDISKTHLSTEIENCKK